MSEFFAGVTFADQTVTPSDDAILHRAVLPDGVLSGCAFSYSGAALTMAAGMLLICGRIVRHTAAQSWQIVNANTGYARLVLTVDLSRTSTKDTFDQVVDSIEYAPSIDAFPDLIQTDINRTGTIYQAIFCIVSLGSSGITGIVTADDAPFAYSSLEDLDFVRIPGSYRLDVPANDALISGCNFSKASVVVEAFDESLAHQTMTAIRSGIKVTRSSTSGVYGPWSFITPPMTPGVEYRTTERFADKPVYTKLIAYTGDSFPTQIVSLAHGISNLDIVISAKAIWKRTDAADDGWRQLPSVDYEMDSYEGQINFVGPEEVEFRIGANLRTRIAKSTQPVYVTLKYTKT